MPTVTKKYYHNIDLDNNQLLNAVIENQATAPTDPVDGQIYYNTVDKKIFYYNISIPQWVEVGASLPANLVTGTGTAGQVSYWNGTNTQAGSANFLWDNTLSKLTAIGYKTFQTLAASENPTLGPELFVTTGWVYTGAEWSGDATTGFKHATGNTGLLTNDSIVAEIAGTYIISYTITERTAGFGQITFGGVTASLGIHVSSTIVITATAATGLSVTPQSTYNGRILFTSIKKVVGANTSPSIVFNDSLGVLQSEIRYGLNNFFIGKNAGYKTYGSFASGNIGIGTNVLRELVAGTGNTAIGDASLLSIVGNSMNTAIGYNNMPSFKSSTATNTYNVAVGSNIMTASTFSGTANNAVGDSVLQRLTTGSSNVAMGDSAMLFLTTGGLNVGIGRAAGFYNTIGAQNTFVGANAGFINYAQTDNGVYIGYSALPSANLVTNEIAIGHTTTGSGSNSVTLGNTAIARTILRGQIGIGIVAPVASAKVQIDSTTQGLLPPRMTLAERNLIVTPATGLLIYQTDGAEGLYQYKNTGGWSTIGSAGSVTSVGLTVPTGLSVANSPITSSGSLDITFTAGYSIPTTTSQTNWDTAFGWGNHASAGYQLASQKGQPNGYASLDGSGLVPAGQLPSYVDDVLEYANLAAFPATGTTGKIYVALDTNETYRWSGSAYIRIANGAVQSVNGSTGIVTITLASLGGISLTSLSSTATGLTYTNTTGVFSLTSGYAIPTTASQTNWDTAFSERRQWDGSSTNLVASTGRTSLGATTVGSNVFTLTNPSAITFLRINADNTVSALDAATFRTAIGAGTSSTSGTVTTVSVTTANGVSGTVATATSTPAITITLGAITPTSVNSVVLSGSSTPTLAVTGTSSISGANTGDNAVNSLYSGLVSNATHTGDATGATALTVVGLRGVALPTLGATAGFLRYTGTGTNTWVFDSSTYLTANQSISVTGDATGSGTTAISLTLATVNSNIGTFNNVTVNAKGLVTAASNVSYLTANQSITLSGDISGTGTTAITTTIGANKVTNAMLAQVATATFLGRVTAATGNVETLTATQATSLLDVFSSTLKGLAPASGGGTTNFLRADGTWTTPGGGGTVTSVSVVTANGISGSVATASSTPAITLTLGAITPTSVNGLTFTAAATGFTIAGGTTSKTLTVSNTLTLSGTDASTLNIGAGGTLGSAAFTASTAYQASNTNLTSLAGLTFASTSFVKMTAAGTFALDTNTYYLSSNPSGYTTNTGTVTTVSVTTANGISGTVATAGTTPAITLSLGAITPSTVNGLTFTAAATGFTIAGGTTSKTLTMSNTLTLAGTDASTLNIGTGGTLGTAAFTAATAYQASSTNLTSLAGLSFASTSFVKMTAAGTFALDTNTYYLSSNPSGYTTNTGTVTTVSVTTANGVSGSVATAGTTPAITITLGAITPTSVNSVVISGSTTPTLAVTGTSSISGSNTGDNAVNSLYSGLVSNATHTGDATGSTALTVVGLRGVALPTLGATAGFLRYTGTGTNTWVFDTSTYLTANQSITLSGDISGTGTTAITTAIGANKVTNAMLAQVATATFKGRTTAATGNVEDLTATQATALLDVFSSTLKGLAPASGGGTTTFLRADGTWATPAGGGSVTTVSVVSANGFAGTVATASSTPAITISTTVTGVLKGNGTAISAAVANTDYLAVASPAYTGTLTTGTLGFTAANPLVSLQSSVNGFNQFLIQNTSTGVSASSDVVVNNNQSTDTTFYGDFGINGSNYSGSGSLALPNAVYLYAASGDLSIGTTTSNAIHFVINNGATDAATIKTTGQFQLPGYTTTSSFSGTAAGYLAFDSSGNIITVTAPTGGSAYSVTSVSTTYSETATSGTKIVKATTAGGEFVITLPTAVGNTATIIIKKTAGTAALTVDGAGTETIDGGLTATLNRVDESITLVSDNTNWLII